MIRVVTDNAIPFIEGVLDPYAEVVRLEGKAITSADVKNADALIIRTRTVCDAKLLDGSSVKFIGSATIGYDHIDLEYCSRKGITVVTAQGCNAMGVAHYLAAVFKEIGGDLTHKKLGVIGAGNVGSRIALLGKKLGMDVLVNDPPKAEREAGFESTELEKMLPECDIVSLHTPYTTKGAHPTENLADKRFFGMMKEGAVFINTSRGEVVDEKALIDALDRHKIARAFIDVWRNEPSINPELLKRAYIATPHIAGYSVQGKANGSAEIVRAFGRFFHIKELVNWYPSGINRDQQDGMNAEEILKEIKGCYDIYGDDSALRHAPEKFEELRNKYDYREEFFTLK